MKNKAPRGAKHLATLMVKYGKPGIKAQQLYCRKLTIFINSGTVEESVRMAAKKIRERIECSIAGKPWTV